MSDWKNFLIYSANKKAETEKSVLFATPTKSEYKGMNFWYNKKLVHPTKNPKFYNLGYTDDMEFKLFRQEKVDGKYKTVEEKTVKGDDLKKCFGDLNKNFGEKKPEPKKEEPEITSDELPFDIDDQELDF